MFEPRRNHRGARGDAMQESVLILWVYEAVMSL